MKRSWVEGAHFTPTCSIFYYTSDVAKLIYQDVSIATTGIMIISRSNRVLKCQFMRQNGSGLTFDQTATKVGGGSVRDLLHLLCGFMLVVLGHVRQAKLHLHVRVVGH